MIPRHQERLSNPHKNFFARVCPKLPTHPSFAPTVASRHVSLALEDHRDVSTYWLWACMCSRPQLESAIRDVDTNLVPINEALKSYEDAWDKWINSWLVIRIDNPQVASSA